MHQRFPIPDTELREFCRGHHIRKMALFGSVLREDFKPESDIDVLVEFEPGAKPGLEFFEIEIALSKRLKRKIDLNTPDFLSHYFRADILEEAEIVYVTQ
jgi:predicted nucleotidyltransferase